MINISKVDSSQAIKYGDLSKKISERENIYIPDGSKPTEVGPMVDTQIFIDPFYRILGTHRVSGGANLNIVKKILSKICHARGMKFIPINDGKNVSDLSTMSMITKVNYRMDVDEKVSRPETKDIQLANEFDAPSIDVMLLYPNKKGALRKIRKTIAKKISSPESKLSKMTISGIDDGVEVVYDLLDNVLTYEGELSFEEGTGVTGRDGFELLKCAFQNKQEFISNKLKIRMYTKDEGKNSEE